MIRHFIISFLQHVKMCQLTNQSIFNLLLFLLVLSVTSNLRLQRMETKNKELNYSISTDDTPSTNDIIPPTVSTTTKTKGVLYAENLDTSLRTI